jgi:predicted metal-dependent hydrolase
MTARTFSVPYGNGEIDFRLKRRQRRTLAISVDPDGSVEVIAPIDAPLGKVLEKVRKRASWIRRQQRFFIQFQPRTPDRQYVGGETHLYLGRQYKLKIVQHLQQRVNGIRTSKLDRHAATTALGFNDTEEKADT